MNKNRIAGLLLVATSAITLSYCNTGGVDGFAIFALIAGFLGVYSNINIQIRPSRRVIAMLLIALMFAVYFRSNNPGISWSSSESIRTQWLLISRYFIVISIFAFFIRRDRVLPPSVVIFLSISVLISPNIYEGNTLDARAIIFTMLYVVASAFFCYSSLNFRVENYSGRNVKIMTFLLIIGISVFSGIYGGRALSSYSNIIAGYIMRYHPAPNLFDGSSRSRDRDEIEFGQMSELDTIKLARAAKSRKVMYRIFSNNNPNYLRCRPYEIWSGRSWQSIENEQRTISAYAGSAPAWPYEYRDDDYTFKLQFIEDVENQALSESYDFFDIWPSGSEKDRIGIPAGAQFIKIPSERMLLWPNIMIEYADDYLAGANYQTAVPRVRQKDNVDDFLMEINTQVPEAGLDSEIVALARRITQGATTNAEKISKVMNYFHTNYDYSLSSQLPRRGDPIKHFLLNQIDSYCEYFATGSVLLLRAVGVPSYYVVGYYVSDYDTVSECWVARQRDAHAWAEAWDEQLERWVIVESTPASGMPEVFEDVNILADYWNYLKFKFQEVRVVLGLTGWDGLRIWVSEALYTALLWLFSTIPGYLLLFFIALLFSGRLKRIFPALFIRTKVSHEIRTLNRKLSTMDRRLARYGLRRATEETIRSFTQRIADAENIKNKEKQLRYIQWYLDYEKQRYNL